YIRGSPGTPNHSGKVREFPDQHVKEKEESDLLVVWALGTYPVGCEDCDIELVLFVLASLKDRDPEVQVIFVKDNFFSVGGKIVLGDYCGSKRVKITVSTSMHVIILNKVPESNKYPLKVSLVEVPQEMPNEVKDDIIVKISVSDYVRQECHFIVRVVFPCHNSCFSHLKDTIHFQESLAFVVGQMEIIDNKFYMYAKDINYINTHFIKKKSYEDNLSQSSLASQNNVRSKLMITHQNIAENLENKLGRDNLLSISSSGVVNKPELDCFYLLEHV
ncbi:5473_t:CDS:2, partial [Diversispora eburnea]